MGGLRTYIIAEAGVNHNGDIELAKRMVGIAASCGCDAVKFQAFKAKRMISANAPKCDYQFESTGSGESHLQMVERLELNEKAHRELMGTAADEGIDFLSSPFDEESATMLSELGMKFMKIPSGEITNLPFLVHVSRLFRPIILSTGMSYLSEVDEAVRIIRNTWRDDFPQGDFPAFTLLHCLTEYPAPVREVNLRAMITLQRAFGLPVGYSDHTLGIEISMAAVAMGAKVIEKHFTMDRSMPGPDHRASLEPRELKQLIRGIRNIEEAMGNGLKVPAPAEIKNRTLVRKGLVALRNLKPGHRISTGDVTGKRPFNGLSPGQKELVVGAIVQKAVERDAAIGWEHLLRR